MENITSHLLKETHLSTDSKHQNKVADTDAYMCAYYMFLFLVEGLLEVRLLQVKLRQSG